MKSFKHENLEYTPSKIIGVQFSILSPEEILKNSVIEIKTKETYVNNYPVLEGLFDPRMGVLDPNMICPTDGLNYMQTPGYFGHIILARPMFFVQYLNDIIKICKCICYKCSKLLINKKVNKHLLRMSSSDRWKYVYSLSENIKRCGENGDGCGFLQPNNITLEGLSKIIATWKNIDTNEEREDKKIIIIFTPEIILKIFKRISDEDVDFMGFNSKWSRPDWMICQILPVCPPAVRPSVKHDVQQRSEDDLTHIYITIIKYNNELMLKIKEENTKSDVIESLSLLLQYNIAMIYDNKVKGGFSIGAQRSGRPYHSIRDRINSKNGRVRGNIMGKRVDYSARSVITGDPNLSIRQLGVPMKVAMNITKPEVVNKKNYKFLLKLVQNGPDIYPGAKILESGNTRIPKTLKYMDRKSIQLELGDIVHRHIMDGDYILFNRQPSLHRMSMMAHEVKVMRVGDTFRFNVANTKPYNADYDGDEMNTHFPQNIMAEIELKELCTTVSQILSPSNNKPIIGIFQDNLLGSYRFTRPNIKLTPLQVMNYLMKISNVNTDIFKKHKEITNFQVLTQIMPPLTLKYETKLFDKDEDKKTSNNILEIENGEYLRGQMEVDVLMGGSKGIIHRIFNDFGQNATANFIDNLQNIITEYMKDSAYSVGINDLIADKKTYDEISEVIKNRKTEVKQLIDEIHLGIYKNKSGDKNIEDFELRVNNILNKATEDTGKIGRKSLNPNNRFLMIVKSGSKGKEINLSQMICCLGQQNVDGKRVPYGFDNRTLPHFQKYDDSPVSRGFVENSYISGLTATDLFFHAMCGRIGLIDTAVKSVTWDTLIMIIENKKPIYTEIGKWIDTKLQINKESVKYYNEQNMEYLDLNEQVYISTTNDDGIITWGELTAVTRHDPGDKLYKVSTNSGRDITVTASKSLIIWNEDKKQFLETAMKDIKIGDYIPVTMKLQHPPLTNSYVNMEDYLPKNKYIYGSDFYNALKLINEHPPVKHNGSKEYWNKWWNDNNNNTFTLPYKDKKSFLRAVRESNIETIKEGFIYVYGSVRKEYLIPDKFELNELNGKFIGLFLADGNTHNGTISISKNNESVKNFVKEWFDYYKINYYVREKNDKSTRGCIITGNCCILSEFIDKFVGIGSYNKFVPTEAFTAPMSFIKGIISGYISGDGHITESSITSSSVSKRLIDGISMLGNYLGMFCKITKMVNENKNKKTFFYIYKLSYRGKWGKIFANEIKLIESDKQNKLDIIKCTKKHLNFDDHNDCVLDKIINIEELSVENNPKMYDVTVPSTLNFSIFNGILCRDTSSTGYIQRRLIKGLEDLMVCYDMTVRNSYGKIIQFSYGENGFDPAKDETQNIPLVTMTIEEIYQHYNINEEEITKEVYTKDVYNKIKKQIIDIRSKTKYYIDMMIEYRKLLIEDVFQYKDESAVKIPIHIERTIQNIQGNLNINGNSLVDITPLELYEMIENMFLRIQKMFSFMPVNTPFKILYFYYLSPKYLLQKRRFNKYGIQLLLEKILLKWKQSIISPGEMVGVIAGQSIGEPTTQMTLNSFHTSSGSASKSNVLSGVPRVEELLRLSKNPKTPSLTIFLKEEHRYEQSKARNIANIIEYTKLSDLIISSQIFFDPKEDVTVIPDDEQLLREFYKYEEIISKASNNKNYATNNKSKWIIRLEFDPNILLEKNINMNDIHFAITNSEYGNDNNLTCVYSDLNSDKLIFRIRIGALLFQKQSKRVNKSIVPLDDQDDINLLKTYQNTLLNNIVLRGIPNVKNIIPRKLQNYLVLEDGNYVKKNIWILDTNGSNLMDVLSLDYIDANNTYSNDVREVIDVLGIFAGRRILYEEFVNVMNPTYINYHHLSLLCDRIMNTKDLVPIYRTGIQNDNIGPIAKATFETHTEEFLKASKHAELDPIKGVSSNIMMGQLGYFGTNSFELLFDVDKLSSIKNYDDDYIDKIDNIQNDFSELYVTDKTNEKCSKRVINIDNKVDNLVLKGPEYYNQSNKCIMEDEYENEIGF